jgi:hypothetical protein
LGVGVGMCGYHEDRGLASKLDPVVSSKLLVDTTLVKQVGPPVVAAVTG